MFAHKTGGDITHQAEKMRTKYAPLLGIDQFGDGSATDGQYETTAEIIRVIALTGCRRSEVIGLQCGEVDIEGSCLRLADSKEGASVRPIGLPVLEYLEVRRDEEQGAEDFVFPGWEDGAPFGSWTPAKTGSASSAMS